MDFRLALKAFTDQKRRFFPHLADDAYQQTTATESRAKRHAGSQLSVGGRLEEVHEFGSVSHVLKYLENEVPQMKVYTHQRLEWLKKATTLSTSSSLDDNSEAANEHSFHHPSTKLIPGSDDILSEAANVDKIAVIELVVPSVFRALIALHSAGSVEPDAISFFSPDEV